MKEETGLDVYVHRPVYQPELFTTNEIMEECELHYITQYIPCILEPFTPKGKKVKIDVKKAIPHAEKSKGKGDEWVWMTFMELVKTLSGKDELIDWSNHKTISAAQLQWIPLHIILHYARELGLHVWEKE